MKLNPVDWMGHFEYDESISPVKARVWRVTSCDAMYVLQLTFAPWCLDSEDQICGFERSHLAVVNAVDEHGEYQTFYVHENDCQIQHAYEFIPSKTKLWMRENDEAPMGYMATVKECLVK